MGDRDILPGTFKPSNYKLSIYNVDIEKWTYSGTVAIALDVKEKNASSVFINASPDITFKESKLKYDVNKTESEIAVAKVEYDSKLQVAELKLAEPVPEVASSVVLTIDFDGKLLDTMSGFYRSKYKDSEQDAEFKYMLSTQFEATSARSAFPCFDEPNLKATFDLTLTVPEHWTVLSNMPVTSSKSPEDGKKSGVVSSNVKTVTFDTSPIMSTYLLAWACGELDYVETFTERSYQGKKIPVRVYTTKGLSHQGQLAVESAAKIIDYFSEVFKIDFVLPKMDMLAVPDFPNGAMENWGLITYRTTTVLFDPKTSPPRYKEEVVYVVAHELAHQWFGNLVTMDWWDDLWLNEGFATWVGWLAVDKLYPEWHVFTSFVVDSLQRAQSLDALRSSHPVQVHTKSIADIEQNFDAISYLKGSSCIRMLADEIGIEVFLAGVAAYLKKHAYQNAKTADLWESVSQESGRDIKGLMDNWILKTGFPLVTVKESGNDVHIRQSRFLSSGDVTAEDDSTVWNVPLSIVSDGQVQLSAKEQLLTTKEATIPGLAGGFYKLNKDTTGVFRVSYPPERVEKLSKSLEKLSVSDQIGLVTDTSAAVVAGAGSVAGMLTLIKAVATVDADYYVWESCRLRLDSLMFAWNEESPESLEGLRKFGRELIKPLYEKYAWKNSTDYIEQQFEVLAISLASFFNLPEYTKDALERYEKYVASGSTDTVAVPPSVRVSVFSKALKASEPKSKRLEVYDYLKKEIASPTSIDGVETALSALLRARDPELIAKNAQLLLSGEIRDQDMVHFPSYMSSDKEPRAALWKFFKDHWEEVRAKFEPSVVVYSYIIKFLLGSQVTKEAHDDIVWFFRDKNTELFSRSLEQSLETIRTRYQWVSRDRKAVNEWLTENGYVA